jgi:hypothetical protein
MCASLLRPDRPMRGEAKPKNRVRVDKKPSPAPRRIGLQNRWRRPRAIWSACVPPRLHHRHRLFRRRSNQGWKPRALPTPPRRSPPPSALLAPLPRSRTNLPRKEVTTHLPPSLSICSALLHLMSARMSGSARSGTPLPALCYRDLRALGRRCDTVVPTMVNDDLWARASVVMETYRLTGILFPGCTCTTLFAVCTR